MNKSCYRTAIPYHWYKILIGTLISSIAIVLSAEKHQTNRDAQWI